MGASKVKHLKPGEKYALTELTTSFTNKTQSNIVVLGWDTSAANTAKVTDSSLTTVWEATITQAGATFGYWRFPLRVLVPPGYTFSLNVGGLSVLAVECVDLDAAKDWL